MVSYKTNLMFALRKIVQCLWVNSVSQVGIEEDVELPRVILIMLEYATLQCHLKGPVSSLPLPHVGYYMCGTLVTHKQWPFSHKSGQHGKGLSIPVEDVLGPLLGGVGGLDGPGSEHVVDGLHDLGHLVLVDHAVSVHVVHPAREEDDRVSRVVTRKWLQLLHETMSSAISIQWLQVTRSNGFKLH